jgi:hypothetical protein
MKLPTCARTTSIPCSSSTPNASRASKVISSSPMPPRLLTIKTTLSLQSCLKGRKVRFMSDVLVMYESISVTSWRGRGSFCFLMPLPLYIPAEDYVVTEEPRERRGVD